MSLYCVGVVERVWGRGGHVKSVRHVRVWGRVFQGDQVCSVWTETAEWDYHSGREMD